MTSPVFPVSPEPEEGRDGLSAELRRFAAKSQQGLATAEILSAAADEIDRLTAERDEAQRRLAEMARYRDTWRDRAESLATEKILAEAAAARVSPQPDRCPLCLHAASSHDGLGCNHCDCPESKSTVDDLLAPRERFLLDPAHPEAHCQRCSRPNVVWFAQNKDWKIAVPGRSGILCPICFVIAYEDATDERPVWALTRAPDRHTSRTAPAMSLPVQPTDEQDEHAQQIAAFSRYIESTPSYQGLSAEAVSWRRTAKVCAEAGEVMDAMSGMLGENPRKGVTHTRDDVVYELLDVALCALGAVEHFTGHDGSSLDRLRGHIDHVMARAALAARPAPTAVTAPTEPDIYAAIKAERERAPAKHGEKSMESAPWDDMKRLRILVEEVGEIANVFNELDLGRITPGEAKIECSNEALQIAAMAASWSDAASVALRAPSAPEPTEPDDAETIHRREHPADCTTCDADIADLRRGLVPELSGEEQA